MADEAGASGLAPIHHKTSKLSDEPMDEPLARFEKALRSEPELTVSRHIGE